MEAYHEAKEQGIYEDDDILAMMMANHIWTHEQEEELETISTKIDDSKIQLFDAAFKSDTRKRIRKELSELKKRQDFLFNTRHSYDYFTCHGVATYTRWNYIIENCTYLDGVKYDFKDVDLSAALTVYQNSRLTEEEMREVSRTEPWITTWSSSCKDLRMFDKGTDEQKRLISWSKLYDNIHQAPDCPPSDIIKDDDMLDGWLIKQARERDKEKNKGLVEDKLAGSKNQNAQEVFIVAETAEDAKRIDDMNDGHAQRLKKQRLKVIEAKGQVDEGNLPDVRLGLMADAHRQSIDKIKGI